jgi:O-antigen ligase
MHLLTQQLYKPAARTYLRPPLLLLLLTGLLVPIGLVYGLTSANELRVVAVVLMILGLMGLMARPFWGLILFVGLLYVRPEDSLPILNGMRFTLMVSMATLLSAALHLYWRREPIAQTPVNGLILGFFVVAVISSTLAGDPVGAALDLSKLVVLYLLVINLVRTREQLSGFITAMLVFSCYLALMSIYYYTTGQVMLEHGTLRSQTVGIFNNPNDLADTLVAGVALALVRLLRASWKARLLYLLPLSAMLYAIFLTHSRGGMLALIVTCFACLVFQSRNKAAGFVLGAAAVAGLLLASSGRMTNFDAQEESANSRLQYWDNAFDALKEQPLTGVGYLNFPDMNGGMAAHNSLVTSYVETGVLGYFCWLGCLYYAFRPGSRRATGESPEKAATLNSELLAACLALATYLLASFWSNHTYTPVLYLLLSLPIAARRIAALERGEPPLTKAQQKQDYLRIGALAVSSIVLITLFARLMQ